MSYAAGYFGIALTLTLMMYFFCPILFIPIGLILGFITLGNLAGALAKMMNGENKDNGASK